MFVATQGRPWWISTGRLHDHPPAELGGVARTMATGSRRRPDRLSPASPAAPPQPLPPEHRARGPAPWVAGAAERPPAPTSPRPPRRRDPSSVGARPPAPGVREALLVTNAIARPAARAPAMLSERVVDGVAVEVDHAVEVEHQQVVGVARISPRPHRPPSCSLLVPLRCTDGVRSPDGPAVCRRPAPARAVPGAALAPRQGRGSSVGSRLRATLSRGAATSGRPGSGRGLATTGRRARCYVHEFSDSGRAVPRTLGVPRPLAARPDPRRGARCSRTRASIRSR